MNGSTYENRYVFFIDILGFKSLIEESNPYEIYQLLDHFSIPFIEKIIAHRSSSPEFNEVFKKELSSIAVSNFSDCITISIPTELDDLLWQVTESIALLQLIILKKFNTYLRGGMTSGEIIHTKDKIFGPALNRSYLLESKYAVHPRILLENFPMPSVNALGYEYFSLLLTKSSKEAQILELTLASAMNYFEQVNHNDYMNSFLIYEGVCPKQFSKLSETVNKLANEEHANSKVKEKRLWIKQKINNRYQLLST